MGDESEIPQLLRDKKKAAEHKNWKELSSTCNYLGVLYASLGRYDDAIEQHREELVLCEKIKDSLGIAVAHRRLGECYAESGSFKTALGHLKKYLLLAIELKNTVELQRARITLGRTYFLHFSADTKQNIASLDKAKNSYTTALEITDKLRGKICETEYAEMRCRALLNLGLIFEHKNDNSAYLKHVSEALALAEKHNFRDDIYRAQISLANFYQSMSDFVKAKEFFDGAIKTSRESKNKINLCEAFCCKALVLACLHDFNGAKHLFKRAYYNKSPVEEDHQKAKSGYKILKLVLEYLKKINQTNNLELHCEYFDKLGDLFCDLKCFSLAVEYYKRELEAAIQASKGQQELAVIYVSLGQTLLDDNQPTEALKYFQKELECRSGSPEEATRTMLKIIEVKINLDVSKIEIIEEYESLLNTCPTDSLKRLVAKDFMYYLESQGDVDRKEEIELLIDGLADDNYCTQDEKDDGKDIESVYDDGQIVSDLTSDSDDGKCEESTRLRIRKADSRSLFKCNEKGETPLHRACIENKIQLVERLIERGHPLNPRDNAGWLPIHEAANHGHASIVSYLISKGAHFNDRGGQFCNGTTPLHDACANGHLDVIRLLIRAGANVIAHDEDGNTPLDCLKAYKKRVSLSTDERIDCNMVQEELTEKMRKDGYDFNVKVPKMKRQRSPEAEILQGIRSKAYEDSSPPRKIGKNRDAIDAKKEYKDAIQGLRRAGTADLGISVAKSRTFAKGLVDEMVDDWLEEDVIVRKRGLYYDLFESKELPRVRASSSKSGQKCSSENSKTKKVTARNRNAVADDDNEEDNEYCRDVTGDSIFYEEPPAREDLEEESIHLEASTNNHSDNHRFTPASLSNKTCTSDNLSPSKPKLTNLVGSTSVSSDSSVSTLCKSDSKLLIKVHVDDKTLLMAVPHPSLPVSWLAEQTATRIYQMKQMRPIISLTTQDGAIFSPTDAIGDVVVNNEVFTIIETWDVEPLSRRYEDACKGLRIIPRQEVINCLKKAESSKSLSLRNLYLEAQHLKALKCALKHERKLKSVDIGFSNLLPDIVDWLIDCEGLDSLCLEGTGTDDLSLSKLVQVKSKLSELNLDFNELTSQSNAVFEEILSWPYLSKLSLRDNFLHENDFVHLKSVSGTTITLEL